MTLVKMTSHFRSNIWRVKKYRPLRKLRGVGNGGWWRIVKECGIASFSDGRGLASGRRAKKHHRFIIISLFFGVFLH